MGADLYIRELFDPGHRKWERKFARAIARRDRLPQGSTQYLEAQQRVEFCYDQMYSAGYFRDSYNDSDVLWKFGLSWWGDVIPMLEEERQLTPEAAAKFLSMMEEREAVFQQNLTELSTPEKRYFRQKYEQLKRFLNQAISLRAPIECSL
jgi:hypothetical protein